MKKDVQSKEERRKKIEGLAKECGLSCVIQCYEVSCSSSHENITQVQEGISRSILSHSYMGERVPKSYLSSLED